MSEAPQHGRGNGRRRGRPHRGGGGSSNGDATSNGRGQRGGRGGQSRGGGELNGYDHDGHEAGRIAPSILKKEKNPKALNHADHKENRRNAKPSKPQDDDNEEKVAELAPAKFVAIETLQPATGGYNLKVIVIDSKIVMDRPRLDGTRQKLAEALIGDESGSVLFTARNEQIEFFKKGASLIIRNAKVEMFKNFMRLQVDRWGLIQLAEKQHEFVPKADHNLSNVEYQLVVERA